MLFRDRFGFIQVCKGDVRMKSDSGIHSPRILALVSLSLILIMSVFALPSMGVMAQDEDPEFTSDFRLQDCRFKSRGVNPFFILKPGYHWCLKARRMDKRSILRLLFSTKRKQSICQTLVK